MKNYFVALAFTALFLPWPVPAARPNPPAAGTGSLPGNPGRAARTWFSGNSSWADPTVIRAEDGNFYLYATEKRKEQHPHPALVRPGELDEGRRGLYGGEPSADNRQGRGQPLGAGHQLRSAKVCAVLFPAGRPTSTPSAGVGPSPVGPLPTTGNDRQRRDRGRYFDRDPVLHRGRRTQVHVLGSFRGIWAIELVDDGLSLKPGPGSVRSPATSTRGNLHPQAGRILLPDRLDGRFHEGLPCGRRPQPVADGALCRSCGATCSACTTNWSGNGNGFVAPGHNAEFITDDKGQDWMLYHTRLEVGGRVTCCSTGSSGMTGGPEVRGHVPARSAELRFRVARLASRAMSVRAASMPATLYAMSVPDLPAASRLTRPGRAHIGEGIPAGSHMGSRRIFTDRTAPGSELRGEVEADVLEILLRQRQPVARVGEEDVAAVLVDGHVGVLAALEIGQLRGVVALDPAGFVDRDRLPSGRRRCIRVRVGTG